MLKTCGVCVSMHIYMCMTVCVRYVRLCTYAEGYILTTVHAFMHSRTRKKINIFCSPITLYNIIQVLYYIIRIQFNSNIYFSRTRKVLVIAVQNMEKMVNKGLFLK